MSYGWLTESSFLPKPAIKINVDNTKVKYNNKINIIFIYLVN